MKRSLLIAGGTLGGLGAVLSITPPQFGEGQPAVLGAVGGTSAAHAATAAASEPATTATQSGKPAAKPSKGATAATKAPAVSGVSGTFTGASFEAERFGRVTVVATFSNGAITNVSASQSPSSWSQYSLSALVPYVNSGKITVEQIKANEASMLPCAIANSCNSRASWTAMAFWQSLQSAISKANA